MITLLECTAKALKPGTAAPVMIGAMKGVYALVAELESPEEQQVKVDILCLSLKYLSVNRIVVKLLICQSNF